MTSRETDIFHNQMADIEGLKKHGTGIFALPIFSLCVGKEATLNTAKQKIKKKKGRRARHAGLVKLDKLTT